MSGADGHLPVWLAPLAAGLVLVVGAMAVATLDRLAAAWIGHRRLDARRAVVEPVRVAHRLAVRQSVVTEHPDSVLWRVGPAMLVGLAGLGICVVPLSASTSVADLPAGIVAWGAVEALAIVGMFVAGWSPNSVQPLIAGYRYLAIGLSVLLISMFVLIGAALPAESLDVRVIVADQAGLWNVVRQPLGLPLFVVVALGITSWGPLDLAGAADLDGGVEAESSGMRLLVMAAGRRALLVAFAAMAAAVFLGGWMGPWLPGPVWMSVKTIGMVVVFVGLGQTMARWRPERALAVCWTVLLPLAFADLAIAGLGSL